MFYIKNVLYKKEKKNRFNNELKIINESQNEYINSTPKKFLKEINNIINKEIKQIKNEKNIANINKIEKQISFNYNNENIFKTPKIIKCNITKILCIKNQNKIIRHPINKKNEYISKIKKDKKSINSIKFLQKKINNYINNRKNIIFFKSLNKPIILKCNISKIYKINDVEKIKIIQKKFREYRQNKNNISNLIINDILENQNYNTRNYIINDYNNKNTINELKSSSSNENTSQISKELKNQKNKEENINSINNLNFNFNEFIQMFIQKINKNINQFVFYKIKNEKKDKNKNIFFSIIKRIIFIQNNNIIKNKKEFNEIFKFIKDNLLKNISDFNKFGYLSFIPKKEEINLIRTQLFKNNNKFLAKFICYCIIFEHNLIYNKNFDNLIEFALIKEPLKDHNIFTIFRYMDFLYENIINKDICLNCLCNNKEKFEIGSNCHHSNNLNNNIYNKFQKIKIFPKCKNKTHSTSLNYSFDEINNNSLNNYKDDDIEIISNYIIYYMIKYSKEIYIIL